MKDTKLSWGQIAVLAVAATPMAAVGIAGAVATYANMQNVLHRGESSLGLVAAGEGATLICALVALAVTLMGQHTPVVVRLGMWLIPMVAAGAGYMLAPDKTEKVVMTLTPLAMTAAGEGIAFVARRVVAYRTGVDIEQQRRSGLLLWHANRAANGSGWRRKASEAAVWRLTKQFAATDDQLSVQLGEIQRYRISEGADANLMAVLTRATERPSLNPVEAAPALPPVEVPEAVSGAHSAALVPVEPEPQDDFRWIADAVAEGEARIKADTTVKLLTTAEVAAMKGVQTGTVRSWKHRGNLRVHETVDGKPMFHPADVAALD